MKELKEMILNFLIMVVFGALLAVITIEWFAGCGEYYYDAKGRMVYNECVFIDFPKGK